MPTIVPAITAIPTAPNPAERSSFNSRAYPWSAALPVFSGEIAAVAAATHANAVEVAASVTAASNSAIAAASSALVSGAVLWVTGTTYTGGIVVYSPIDFQTYRRKSTGAGTTDPSLDPTNWAAASVGEVTLAGPNILSNKRISAYYYLDRTIINAAATGAVTLDLSVAGIFDLTLSGNTTVSIANAPTLAGETLSFVVRVTQGATPYLFTWFNTIAWLTAGGTAPIAPAANKVIEYVFSSTTSGQYLGRKGAAT